MARLLLTVMPILTLILVIGLVVDAMTVGPKSIH